MAAKAANYAMLPRDHLLPFKSRAHGSAGDQARRLLQITSPSTVAGKLDQVAVNRLRCCVSPALPAGCSALGSARSPSHQRVCTASLPSHQLGRDAPGPSPRRPPPKRGPEAAAFCNGEAGPDCAGSRLADPPGDHAPEASPSLRAALQQARRAHMLELMAFREESCSEFVVEVFTLRVGGRALRRAPEVPISQSPASRREMSEAAQTTGASRDASPALSSPLSAPHLMASELPRLLGASPSSSSRNHLVDTNIPQRREVRRAVRVGSRRVRKGTGKGIAFGRRAVASEAGSVLTTSPWVEGSSRAFEFGQDPGLAERRRRRRKRRQFELDAAFGTTVGVEAAHIERVLSKGQAEMRARTRTPTGKAGTIHQNTVGFFLTMAAQEPLLTQSEEIQLAVMTQELLRIQAEKEALLEAFGRKPTLEELAEAACVPTTDDLIGRIEMGKLAKERMIRANMRLVVACAKRYSNQGLHVLDLWQEGNLGLIKGVERFDPSKGFRLSTYAYWWIRQAITRAIANKGRAIRLPMRTIDSLHRINAEIKTYKIENDYQEPSLEVLAELSGLSVARVKTVLLAALPVLSLDTSTNGTRSLPKEINGRSMIMEEKAHWKWASAVANIVHADMEGAQATALGGEDFHEALLEVEESMLKEGVQDTLQRTLCPREAQVLQLRYGLFGERPRTLADVGKILGISLERARQIEKAALKKLMKSDKTKLSQYLWMCLG